MCAYISCPRGGIIPDATVPAYPSSSTNEGNTYPIAAPTLASRALTHVGEYARARVREREKEREIGSRIFAIYIISMKRRTERR